jgi:hypothetical protein
MRYVAILRMVREDGVEVSRSRVVTESEVGHAEMVGWGTVARYIMDTEWRSSAFGAGYYHVTVQVEEGLSVRLLGEAGERVLDEAGHEG